MDQRRNLIDYVIILNSKDNVATALVDLPAGEYVYDAGENRSTIVVPEDISAGFKLALSDIQKAEPIYKYGYIIGTAKVNIQKGHCVHVHNLVSSV